MPLTALILVVASIAGLIAWRQASQLDRQPFHEQSAEGSAGERRAWALALAALVAAAVAAALFQVALLERLRLGALSP